MRIEGKSVFGGIAIGKIEIFKKGENQISRKSISNIGEEIARFEAAKAEASEQLEKLYQKALVEVGEVNAAIFEVHKMMLEDLDYLDAIHGIIENQQVNAEYAVAQTSDNFSQMFVAMDDEYMSARAADIRDISDRLINILCGIKEGGIQSEEPVILLAEDLAPSETVSLDKSKVLSFVTRYGSANSHTAILARTMNIPALISVDFPMDVEGKLAIVDGNEGKLIVDPTVSVLEDYQERQKKLQEEKELLQQLKGKENITSDGRKIQLYANIGGVSDVAAVLANDAGGIGLFRSEFLYLQSDDFPTEEQQFSAYKSVVETMAGKKVIIRTLDIGADKKVDYLGLKEEDNPALGYRAIRICLDQPEIFKTQLRAIYRASYYGNLAIMFPMIISLDEVKRIKAILTEVKSSLDVDGLPYKDVEIGVMIETPAAAIVSDMLAKEVDFFSIGTNDLTQYTLAIDRQNEKLDSFYDAHHPAVLRMIQMVIENGHKENCWVGICGELGADLELTETFINMGIDELSVSPSMVLRVREKIRNI